MAWATVRMTVKVTAIFVGMGMCTAIIIGMGMGTAIFIGMGKGTGRFMGIRRGRGIAGERVIRRDGDFLNF